ncbi:hypothetical protein niasHT_034957 [Heterodera trifolii]|uniref:PAS domain-containing protein n=1 Tax=Heterodera trifolii TaxID=157864 RepID=A0ABD2ICL7_9BILA
MAPYSNSAQNSPEAAATTTTIIMNDPHQQQQQQVVVSDDHRRRGETSPAAGEANHHKLARRKKRLLHQQQQTQWVGQAIKWKKRRLALAISGTEMIQQDNNNNCNVEEDEDEALDIFQSRKVASLSEPSTPQSCSDSNPITATTTTTATRASATNAPPSAGTAGPTTEVRIPSCPSASSQPSAGGACSLPDMASSDQPNSPAAGAGDTSAALLGRRLLGSLLVSLPDGTILECRNATTTATTGDEDEDDDAAAASPTTTTTAEENIAEGGGGQLQQQQRHRHNSNFLSPMGQNFSNCSTAGQLSTVCRPGHSLLALLHGKGAQTLLLNAFCGHSRRRMYARLKWSDSCLRACELLCEFSKDPQSVSRRLASIQLFCVQSANNNGMPCADAGSARLTFTTRHNASGALIYLDSASIPLLGHFPSEITGKSLFALVHPEDAQRVRDAHQQLHATGGVQIVRTPALRLAAYAGHAVTVDAEWAAFVNPWTSTVEMVVGRHTFVADGQNATAQQQYQQHHHQHQQQKPINNVPTGKNVLLQSVDESAADTAFLQELFMKHVPAAQPSPPMPNAVIAVCQNEMPKMAVMVKQEEPEVVEMGQQQHHQQQQLKWKANNTNNNNGTTTGSNELSNGTSQVYLSYNQINCLENVHRLLKSQSSNGSAADGEPCGGGKMPADSAPPSQPPPPSQLAPSASPPSATTAAVAATTPSAVGGAGTALTRELLQLHDQRWEERCRAHWRRRLSQQTTTVAAASPRCHQTQQQHKQKRPLSQEQPGNFAGRSPPAVADWHHHPQQHHHVAKLARCRSEQRRSAWPMPAAVVQFEDEPSPLHAVPPHSAGAVVAHNEQPPCGALPPAELIALIAAVLQNVPVPSSPPAEAAKIGIVAAPPIMNDGNNTPLGLHPQLLDQLLQAAASARTTLNARLLKQDSNNNQHNSSTSCSNNI